MRLPPVTGTGSFLHILMDDGSVTATFWIMNLDFEQKPERYRILRMTEVEDPGTLERY